TPTPRHATEMTRPGPDYHRLFRGSGQTAWPPEMMGNKFVPCVIIWDEVMTVLKRILENFLDLFDGRVVKVFCCGDPRSRARCRTTGCSRGPILPFKLAKRDETKGYSSVNVRLTCLQCVC
ncbi:MAG: hypothetical protein AB2556_25610, partial [Candidatus Thiodiazotropha sp.]